MTPPNHLRMSIRVISFIHIFLMVLSNILVQYPFKLFGLHTTWGAFSYPLIFITTDLTTRLLGAAAARRVIFKCMIPGLIASFILAVLFNNASSLEMRFELPMRIAFASFCAYVVGQLLDIFIFQQSRQNASWWVPPSLATTFGNVIDTFLFFTIAFYRCHHPFLSQHWPEIAWVDLSVKTISLLAFIPLYGVILNSCLKYRKALHVKQNFS